MLELSANKGVTFKAEGDESKYFASDDTFDLFKHLRNNNIPVEFHVPENKVDERHHYFAEAIICFLIIHPEVAVATIGAITIFIKKRYQNKIVKIKGIKIGDRSIDEIEGNADKVNGILNDLRKDLEND